MWPQEADALAAGQYNAIFSAACDYDLPLFVFGARRPTDVAQYARRFPSLRIIVDHCGLVSNLMRRVIGGEGPLNREAQLASFEHFLALADLPNVALKWAHAPAMFDAPAYPGEALWPILRRAIDRFGADRVMWASDSSGNQTGESWAELLFSMMGNRDLSLAERQALLGGTARAWLNWPTDTSDAAS
jgi:predicted TIM-barrel fold metal-dependent hydrolase